MSFAGGVDAAQEVAGVIVEAVEVDMLLVHVDMVEGYGVESIALEAVVEQVEGRRNRGLIRSIYGCG
jgi:hypothetical protein